jgi:hypothetical protein
LQSLVCGSGDIEEGHWRWWRGFGARGFGEEGDYLVAEDTGDLGEVFVDVVGDVGGVSLDVVGD